MFRAPHRVNFVAPLAVTALAVSSLTVIAPATVGANGCAASPGDIAAVTTGASGYGGAVAGQLQITNEAQLLKLAVTSGDWGRDFVQTADLNLEGCTWSPIGDNADGTNATRFTGTFDGGDNEIRNLTFTDATTNFVGLFGYVAGATLTNIRLVDVSVTGQNQVGGLVGRAQSATTISNSSVTGTVNGGEEEVGGLAGRANSTTISNSYATGTVSAISSGNEVEDVGGLVGVANTTTISNSYATGNVLATGGDGGEFVSQIGGLVGRAVATTISNSYAAGDVTADAAGGGAGTVGGLVGELNGFSADASIFESFATGDVLVTGSANPGDLYGAGGLVGQATEVDIADSYALGNVTAGKGVGGLIGALLGVSTVTNTYSAGLVTGDSGPSSDVGGLIGYADAGADAVASFWDTETSGQSESAGGVGRSTDDMKDIETYAEADWNITANWSASKVWSICADVNGGYPYLIWQFPDGDGLEDACKGSPEPVECTASASDIAAVTTGASGYGGAVAGKLQITNEAQLLKLAETSGDWGRDFVQTADLNLEGCTWSPIGRPIGFTFTYFNGSFDGGGKSISNLTLEFVPDDGDFDDFSTETVSDDRLGMFGIVKGANLRNINLVALTLAGDETIGGLAGSTEDDTTISNSSVTGTVSGSGPIGGLVGQMDSSTISQSWADVDVAGQLEVGGLVGAALTGAIDDSYALGKVEGGDLVGGLVGTLNDGGTVRRTYSAGSVTGSSDVGGLVGFVGGNGTNTVTHSFWDTETSGQSTSAGGLGRTTAQMKQIGTFTGATWNITANWSASKVWGICAEANGGYPYLIWQFPGGVGLVDACKGSDPDPGPGPNPGPSPGPGPSLPSPSRLGGANRIDTAVLVSRQFFGAGVPVVYLATAGGFADALVAGPAAGAGDGPVLLTETGQLPAVTLAELRRLAPQRIVVTGGVSAVSADVFAALSGLAPVVERVGGANRYETAAQITRSTQSAPAPVVYVATGEDFADAISGGPAAGVNDAPVLLVRNGSIPAVTIAELQRLQPSRIVVLGLTAAVSAEVQAELGGFAPVVQRIGGANRYQTATALSAATFGPGVPLVFLATGTGFADALAAAPPAIVNAGPVLLVRPTCVPAATLAELQRLRPGRIVVLGGDAALSPAVANLTACPS